MAADPVATIFMSPEAGVLVTLPAGTDGVVTLTDDNAAIAAVNIDAVQSLVGNSIIDQGGNRSVDFIGSGNFLTGVLSVNQEAGNMNNQANIRSIAIAMADGGLGDVQINVNASQELRNNSLQVLNAGNTSVTIDNSFNNGSGIVGINQTTGNLNQQLTIVAIGIGLNVGPDAIQVGDAQLGQIGTEADNHRTDDGTLDAGHNTLSNSFNDFSGIAQISQVTGDMNRVTQAVAVSVTTPVAP
ncbi:hypothetical protein [Hypericibacter sp.]|uniref:hypothetical protein n=1 Tax=Hypericibacter sp. TaxID=2705401 RepID=UPI003D6D52F8